MIDWALLLAALIAVESGGDPTAVGDKGRAVGVLQIHAAVVEDCNRVLAAKGAGDHSFSLEDRNCEAASRGMAVIYLRWYGAAYERETGEEASMEVLARIWNGGPQGYRKRATEAYWQKVKAAMEDRRR